MVDMHKYIFYGTCKKLSLAIYVKCQVYLLKAINGDIMIRPMQS